MKQSQPAGPVRTLGLKPDLLKRRPKCQGLVCGFGQLRGLAVKLSGTGRGQHPGDADAVWQSLGPPPPHTPWVSLYVSHS